MEIGVIAEGVINHKKFSYSFMKERNRILFMYQVTGQYKVSFPAGTLGGRVDVEFSCLKF